MNPANVARARGRRLKGHRLKQEGFFIMSAVMSLEPKSRMPQRRRGEALRQAVHAAVVAELVDRGYSGLTLEGVATRARAARTSVYRYWPSKEELVLDTIRPLMLPIEKPPFTGSIREDFLWMLHRMSQHMDTPVGLALHGLLGEGRRYPKIVRTVVEEMLEPRKRIMLEALRQAAGRGEISAGAVSLLPVHAAIGLVVLHGMQHFAAPTERDLVEIVDRAILPMLGLPGTGA